MWYVVQTVTGREEELVHMIRDIIPSSLYVDCFVIYYERVWRKQQQSIVHVERLFPGYVFVVSAEPEELFLNLKKVPAMSKLIADGNHTFLSLEIDEETLFQNILGENHIIHLSYVKTDGKNHIRCIAGPLKNYMDQVVRFQLKKRYVIIRLKIMGIEKTVALGIILNEDIQQEITYGKVEIPMTMPDYDIPRPEHSEPFAVGDQVKVISGTLENMAGVVWRVKKNTVDIGVHLFGQDMSIEVPMEDICKNFL